MVKKDPKFSVSTPAKLYLFPAQSQTLHGVWVEIGIDFPRADTWATRALLVRAALALGTIVGVWREFLAAIMTGVYTLELLTGLVIGISVGILVPLVPVL